MSDDPMDAIPSFNRVSIRAVLAHDGEDVEAALSEAGIFNPVAVPVLIGDGQFPSGAILGDGFTPNLTGVLETEQQEDFDVQFHSQPSPTERNEAVARPNPRQATILPAAYGMQPLAPIRRRRG